MKLFPAIAMPEWMIPFNSRIGECFPTREEQLRFAIALALENVERKTGGPFGAAVFRLGSGELVAFAANLVTSSGQSCAHAEMLAIASAQLRIGRVLNDCVLVSSCEPCVMCFGGTLWSGVKRLVYGAPGAFARETGFDEGDKVPGWHASLEARGIVVEGPLLEAEAGVPFERYRELGGVIY